MAVMRRARASPSYDVVSGCSWISICGVVEWTYLIDMPDGLLRRKGPALSLSDEVVRPQENAANRG